MFILISEMNGNIIDYLTRLNSRHISAKTEEDKRWRGESQGATGRQSFKSWSTKQ